MEIHTKKTLIIHPDELSEKWIKRAKSLNCNTLAIHPAGGKESEQSLCNLVEKCKCIQFQNLIQKAKSNGLNIEYHMHTIKYLLPETLFENHQEWFRVDATQKRNPDQNFCVSNNEALEFVIENAANLVDSLYGSSNNYYFWMDDVKNSICNCEKCREFNASDQQMIFINAVLKKLKKKIPNAKMAFLAYFDTQNLPSKINPEPNVFLEYAPFERDFSSSASDMKAEEISKIERMLEFFGQKDSVILEY